MLRVVAFLVVGVSGLYFTEQYFGTSFGVGDVIHRLGDTVANATGFTLFGGQNASYSNSNGISVTSGVSALAASIGNTMQDAVGYR